MKSTKTRKPLLSLLLVLMALVMSVSAVAPVASARSVNADKVDKRDAVFTVVDKFLKALPDKGGKDNWGYIGPDALVTELASANPPLLVDVRNAEAYAAGHIPGAVNIEATTLLDNLDKLGANDRPIVVYCWGGYAAAISMMGLTEVGYTNVLAGAYNDWTAAGLSVVK